jgi:hypothetical protein
MKVFPIQSLSVAILLLCVEAAPRASADDVIFNNSANDLVTRFDPANATVGDEILLGGTSRYLTQFDFEYWGTNTANPAAFTGRVSADVKLYLNDGAPFNGYATPGTVLWDSGSFGLNTTDGFGPTPRSTIVFSVATGDFPSTGLFLPSSDITWTVQISGLGATDSVGLDLYSPPTVGGDYPDYWQNSGSGWQLLTNTIPMNFGARMFASAEPVPEPSWAAFSIATALLGILTVRLKTIRKK